MVALQILTLWLFDGLLFRGVSVNVGGGSWARSSGASPLFAPANTILPPLVDV